jgi:hypothetical protein
MAVVAMESGRRSSQKVYENVFESRIQSIQMKLCNGL